MPPVDLQQDTALLSTLRGRILSIVSHRQPRLFSRSAGLKALRWSAVAYACFLTAILLAPFEFKSPIVPNGARRIDQTGVEFAAPGIINSQSPVMRLAPDIAKGTGFSIEVWAAANGHRQHGPARIVSYSLASRARNFTLGQEGLDLVMLLRTTHTNLSAYIPHVRLKDVFTTTAVQHIVVTYDFRWQNIYINGRKRLRTKIPGGDFSNWEPAQYLLLGNEATGDAPWLGKLFLVAIYNRGLSAEEIRRDFAAGPKAGANTGVKRRGAVALYEFTKGPGKRFADTSGAAPALDLWRPKYFIEGSENFLIWPQRMPANAEERLEVIANVVLFVPFGFFLYTALCRRGRRCWSSAVLTLLIGALVSLTFELTQFFLPGRTSSLLDVVANASGAALGSIIAGALLLRGRSRTEA